MAINDDIVLTKGIITVSLFTSLATENLRNNVQIIPPVQTAQNQEEGAKDAKIVDLLRITETYVFRGMITKTDTKSAKEVKDELRTLAKGANVNGAGPVTLTYEDESLEGYITDLVIKKAVNDNTVVNYSGDDSAEYDVTVTITLGKSVA